MKLIGIGLAVFGIWYLISQSQQTEQALEARKAQGKPTREYEREGGPGGGLNRGRLRL